MVNRIIADDSHPSPGDPAKMVQIMIGSVDEAPAPRRIALGSDAFHVMREQRCARLATLETQRELACSTDFPPDERHGNAPSWFAPNKAQ
jgi:hypothetical protein